MNPRDGTYRLGEPSSVPKMNGGKVGGCYYCENVAGGPDVKPSCPLHEQPSVGLIACVGDGSERAQTWSERLSALPASAVGSIAGGGGGRTARMSRTLGIVLLAAALILLGGTPASADSGEVVALITAAAVAHNVSPAWLVNVARCESRFDPFAVSADGSNLGLFQLNRHGLLPAFYAWATAQGLEPDVFSPSQQANFSAEQFAAGQSSAWSCA